jgi:hypothetical protein
MNNFLLLIKNRDLLDELTASEAYADTAVLSPTSALAAHAAHTAEALSALAASRAREDEEEADAAVTPVVDESARSPAAEPLVFMAASADSSEQGMVCYLSVLNSRCRCFHALSLCLRKSHQADKETPGGYDETYPAAEPGMRAIFVDVWNAVCLFSVLKPIV